MNKVFPIFKITLLFLLFSSGLRAQRANEKTAELKLYTPTEKQVKITGGAWYNAMELERQYLLIKLQPFYKIVNQYFPIYLPIGKTETVVNKKKYDATDH